MFVLLAWTLLAFLWWSVAFVLLHRRCGRQSNSVVGKGAENPADLFVSVFKAVPLLRGESPEQWDGALRTILSELDDQSELLLGLPEVDVTSWQPLLEKWKTDYPQINLRVIERAFAEDENTVTRSNPKIVWMKVLAEQARGELWLWSDLDVSVPSGFLKTLRAEYDNRQGRYVTTAYRVVESSSRGVWDALFVNVEFLPGVFLLGSSGRMKTGFGAGMLFSRNDFETFCDWEKLGKTLLDDKSLAEMLQGGSLSRMIPETDAVQESWGQALSHYWRWQKTIRWADPAGYAAQILIVPLIGWVCYLAFDPTVALAGLLAVWFMEMIVGLVLLPGAGYRFHVSLFPALGLWPWLRAGCWILAWTPFPVWWRGRKWSSAQV